MGKAITKAKEIAAEAAQTADKAAGGENIDQTKETATAGTNDATEAAVEQAPAVTLDELESMDMSAFTEDETEDGPRPAWRRCWAGCGRRAMCWPWPPPSRRTSAAPSAPGLALRPI